MTKIALSIGQSAPRFAITRERFVADKIIIYGIAHVQRLPREKQSRSDMNEACRVLRQNSGPGYLGTLLHQVQNATGMRINIFTDMDDEEEVSDEFLMFSEICHSTASSLEKELSGLNFNDSNTGNVISFEAHRIKRGLVPFSPAEI